MAVNIVFSTTNGGSSITTLSHGNSSPGSNTTAQTLYIRHDGTNPITNCKLYMAQKSGAYSGAATAAQDFTELLGWGDGNLSTNYGGMLFNFNAIGSFPGGNWPVYNNKTPTSGNTVRTGVGDSTTNAISIPSATGAPSVGVIPQGSTPNVRFQVRFKVPNSEGTLGNRQVDLRLRYTYTS